jgi:hypothetical protein
MPDYMNRADMIAREVNQLICALLQLCQRKFPGLLTFSNSTDNHITDKHLFDRLAKKPSNLRHCPPRDSLLDRIRPVH